ncbi:MAG: hypothetical protein ACE15C_03545 [Phycisphaerae bacterium]
MKAFLEALRFAVMTTAVLAMIIVTTAAMAINASRAGDRGVSNNHAG